MSPQVLMFVVFLSLKLAGVIAWSWWWVTCPLWVGVPIVLIFSVGREICGGNDRRW